MPPHLGPVALSGLAFPAGGSAIPDAGVVLQRRFFSEAFLATVVGEVFFAHVDRFGAIGHFLVSVGRAAQAVDVVDHFDMNLQRSNCLAAGTGDMIPARRFDLDERSDEFRFNCVDCKLDQQHKREYEFHELVCGCY